MLTVSSRITPQCHLHCSTAGSFEQAVHSTHYPVHTTVHSPVNPRTMHRPEPSSRMDEYSPDICATTSHFRFSSLSGYRWQLHHSRFRLACAADGTGDGHTRAVAEEWRMSTCRALSLEAQSRARMLCSQSGGTVTCCTMSYQPTASSPGS